MNNFEIPMVVKLWTTSVGQQALVQNYPVKWMYLSERNEYLAQTFNCLIQK